jgi:hypothetical protein
MPDANEKLTPADPDELATALAFALKFEGRKRQHDADAFMAHIVAKRLVRRAWTFDRRRSAHGRGCEPGRSITGRWRSAWAGPTRRRSARAARAGCGPGGQVRSTARQLGPGLELTGPPPINVFPFMSQIEAWPLVF